MFLPYSYLIPALFSDFSFLQHILLIPALFLPYSCLISALFLDFWLSAAYSAYSYLIPALFFDFGFLQHIVLIPALFLAYSGLIFRFLLSAAYSAYSCLIPGLFLPYFCFIFGFLLSAAYSAYFWLITALFVPCIIPALSLPYFYMFAFCIHILLIPGFLAHIFSRLISAKIDTNLLIIYVKFICDILAANNKQKIHTYLALVIILTDLNHAARFPLFVTPGSDGVQFFSSCFFSHGAIVFLQ